MTQIGIEVATLLTSLGIAFIAGYWLRVAYDELWPRLKSWQWPGRVWAAATTRWFNN